MSYASYLDTRCAYVTANARRCSATRTSEHIPLCVYHQRQYLDQQGAHGGAMELLLPIEKFDSAADINRALGQVFQALARNAIPSRTAATLAYICQLLLNTLPALERKNLEAKAVPALKKILIHVLKHPLPKRPRSAVLLHPSPIGKTPSVLKPANCLSLERAPGHRACPERSRGVPG